MNKMLKLGSWTLEVNRDQTSEFYDQDIPDDCNCVNCQNYKLHRPFMSKSLIEFLDQFGVDPTKEGEFMEFGPNEQGEIHYQGFYHVIGRILEGPKKVDEEWNQANFIKIDNFEFGFSSEDIACVPKGFPEPILQLHFEVYIPWRHEEPYN